MDYNTSKCHQQVLDSRSMISEKSSGGMRLNPSDRQSMTPSALSDPELDIIPASHMLSPNNALRRTFMNRTFSKVGKGSVRGSIFSLCACAIGSGVLSLPYVLGLCGWALGISFIFVGAMAAIWSNTILAELAVDNGLANLS